MSTNQPFPSVRIADRTEANSVVKPVENTDNAVSKGSEEMVRSNPGDFEFSASVWNHGTTKPMTPALEDSQQANEGVVATLGDTLQATTSSLLAAQVNEAQTDLATKADSEGNSAPASKKILTEFTCFPTLPIELRQEIWKDACNIPRVIDLWGVWLKGTVSIGVEDIWRVHMWKSHNAVPSILHTSHEARTVALRHYTLDFGTRIMRPIGPASISVEIAPKIYVNWGCDVICLIKYIGGGHMDDLISKPIRQLALPFRDLEELRHGLLKCANLEQVWLYHEPTGLYQFRQLVEEDNRGFNATTPFKLAFRPLTDDAPKEKKLYDMGIIHVGCVRRLNNGAKYLGEHSMKVTHTSRKIEFLYKLVDFEETGL